MLTLRSIKTCQIFVVRRDSNCVAGKQISGVCHSDSGCIDLQCTLFSLLPDKWSSKSLRMPKPEKEKAKKLKTRRPKVSRLNVRQTRNSEYRLHSKTKTDAHFVREFGFAMTILFPIWKQPVFS